MKRIILVLTVALIVAVMAVNAAPAVAQPVPGMVIVIQQDKDTGKSDEDKDKTDQKAKMEEKKDESLPKSGGLSPGSIALLGLGGVALLIGGGMLVRRVTQ